MADAAADSRHDNTLMAISGHQMLLFDHVTVFIVSVLMAIGVVMVYSASVSVDQSALALTNLGRTPVRQALYVAAGFVLMLFVALVDYRVMSNETVRGRRITFGFWLLALALLVAVLIPGVGVTRLGATRWLRVPIGSIDAGFQPAEFAKVA